MALARLIERIEGDIDQPSIFDMLQDVSAGLTERELLTVIKELRAAQPSARVSATLVELARLERYDPERNVAFLLAQPAEGMHPSSSR